MIEVGEYIRTSAGKIDKITNNNYYMPQYVICEKGIVDKENIVNHSKDLIDLIEVGDYVNGERILDITGDYIHTNETDHNRFYLAKHIKTMLTKEQYQANYYIVERKEKKEKC